MAMFSTFISWQLMQWGVPYWAAFVLTLGISFAGGIAIERLLFKPLAKAPILTNVAGFIALYAILNSFAGLIWDFTIKQYPTPFGSSPFLGSQLISTHQAGMIGVTVLLLVLLYLFFQFTRVQSDSDQEHEEHEADLGQSVQVSETRPGKHRFRNPRGGPAQQ